MTTLRWVTNATVYAAMCVVGGCGGGDKVRGDFGRHVTFSVKRENIRDYDGDRDGDGMRHDQDDRGVLSYGRTASIAETRQVSMLLRRYLAAAASDDGEKACTSLYSLFAQSVVAGANRMVTGEGRVGQAWWACSYAIGLPWRTCVDD